MSLVSLFNVLPELPATLQTATKQAVRKAAFDIQALAQQGAPVDTGFLKGSIYTVTHSSSTYAAAAGTPSGDATLLPEVPKPPTDQTAIVAVGASYGIYVEFGTANAPAQPYLTPAAEFVKPQYEAAMAKIIHKAMAEAAAAGLARLVADLGAL